jgi:mannosyl-oligosaccharide alpha-1,2-mannosidase
MEYKYLAHLTGRAQYYDKVEHVMEIMYNTTLPNGLFPTKWDIETGTPQNRTFIVLLHVRVITLIYIRGLLRGGFC